MEGFNLFKETLEINEERCCKAFSDRLTFAFRINKHLCLAKKALEMNTLLLCLKRTTVEISSINIRLKKIKNKSQAVHFKKTDFP